MHLLSNIHANNTVRKQLQRITMGFLQLIATTASQKGRLSSSIFKHGEHFIHRERRFLASSGTMEAKGYFDAIDNAREILEDDKTLAEKVPSCVVVGMQSVGKSAVLSRISGIRFPQDSEVCTRVAIELRLRRSDDPSNLLTMKAGNHESKKIDKSNDAGKLFEQALKEAQKTILKGRQFEDKMSVKIEKEDPDIPDVTLVDLPGVFFAKERVDDALEEKVKSMISERVNNEMALILHVIPVDQDTDTVSTWRYVHEADKQQRRTISVLTKADLALKDGTDVLAKRIRKIAADSKTSECFVVHGAAECDIDEQLQLENVVSCIEGLELEQTINVGTAELTRHIQERMLDHIKDKVPEMRSMLEDQLRKSQDELKKLGREPIQPVRIAIRDYDLINDHLDEAYQSFQPVLRQFVDNLTNAIFGIDMKPLGIVNTSKADRTLLHNFVRQSSSHHSYAGDKRFDSVDQIPLKTREFHILALEVKKIGDDNRRMINTQFVGKETELKEWLTTFANPFEEVTKVFMDDVFDLFYDQVIQPSITNNQLLRRADSVIHTIILRE